MSDRKSIICHRAYGAHVSGAKSKYSGDLNISAKSLNTGQYDPNTSDRKSIYGFSVSPFLEGLLIIWTLSQSISGYFINRGRALGILLTGEGFFFLFSESILY